MTIATHTTFPAISKGQVGAGVIPTVDARQLHAFLGVGRDFSSWVKDRIEAYGFSENSDFVTFDAAPQNGGAGNRGARKEYALSLDMAKELAMVERTDKGREVRRYFIECERRLKEAATPAIAIPQTLSAALRLAAEQAEEIERHKAVLTVAKPKAEALDRIATAQGSMCITDAAKALQVQPKELFSFLRSNGWIYKRPGTETDIAFQCHLNDRTLEVKVEPFTGAGGIWRERRQVRVTPKGLTVLAQALTGREPLRLM